MDNKIIDEKNDIYIEETQDTTTSTEKNTEEKVIEDNATKDAKEFERLKKSIKYTGIIFRLICAFMPLAIIFILYALASPVAFTKHEMISNLDNRIKDAQTIQDLCLIYCMANLIMIIGLAISRYYYSKRLLELTVSTVIDTDIKEIDDNNIEEDNENDEDSTITKLSEVEIVTKDMKKLYNELMVRYLLFAVFGIFLVVVNCKVNNYPFSL